MVSIIPNRLIARAAAAAALTTLLGVCAAAQAEGPTWDPKKSVALPSGGMVYKNLNKAIKMAGVWGNRATGAHGTFGKFVGNFETPVHTHTFAYHAIVVAGVMTNPFGKTRKKNPPKMAAGSYWFVPAGMPHSTACVSKTPCQFYMTSDGAFDFKPVKSK